ncbi:polysaccharide pyruvyl transferase family protein [Hyphomicrobium sp.]|uniref:polysaccharide pyruvyl transferase family protein n=1 Tax=Hyphomicrobium sp. TaxID=82 RepID=UPI002D7A0E42|nr:hypothetical protein [Hyphomicrobium sp.]HET6387832.1 hypothetical protein [Hyphomicrobium sp.]
MTDLLPELRADIERFFAEFAGTEVFLVRNEGNDGDCLILASTLTAMAKAGIDVRLVDDQADFKDRVVFMAGGGNLVGIYQGMQQSIAACRSTAARIVILPHTLRGNAPLLESLDSRTTIWCRERRSLDHVTAVNPRIDCRLGHDMAFHCDAGEFLDDPKCNASGMPLLRSGLERAGVSLGQLAGMPVARLMRTDREARSPNQKSDLDLSRAFGGVGEAEISKLRAWCFLKTLSVTQHVVTDRLHVAVGCALLGKSCELLDNSYNKNREIYAHSLARFPSITFTQSGGANIADQPSSRKPLLARLAKHARRLTGLARS